MDKLHRFLHGKVAFNKVHGKLYKNYCSSVHVVQSSVFKHLRSVHRVRLLLRLRQVFLPPFNEVAGR